MLIFFSLAVLVATDSFFCAFVCVNHFSLFSYAMIRVLLHHNWKKFNRSVSFSKELVANLFLAFIGLMVVGYFLAIGFAMEIIITKGLKQPNSFEFLNSLLLYYFAAEFLIRYVFQKLPALDAQPYLHLPLKRSRIVHFLLIKSNVHILNSMAPLLFAPYAFTVVADRFGAGVALNWWLTLWIFSMGIHYIILLFKNGLENTLYGILSLISIISILAAADYYGWFKLSEVSSSLFGYSVEGLFLFFIASCFIIMLYYFNFRLLQKSMYPDNQMFHAVASWNSTRDWGFLKNFGPMGDWINLELKLIWRCKRPRFFVFSSGVFFLYGLVIYPNAFYTEQFPDALLFFGYITTGIFMLNYGQLLYSWQGGHFDFTLTRPISSRLYIESKYWMLNSITVISFLLSIPYGLFGWKILLINAAMTLYNLGVNIFIVMNMAMWKPKKIDVKKSGMWNFEGAGSAQWVMGLPLFLGPYVIYLPLRLAGYPNLGISMVGLVGLIGIILRSYLLKLTTHRLEDRRYVIAAGFRKD